MPSFQTQVIRIAADTTSKDNILDLNTSAEPQAWWARDLTLQVGVFAGAVLLDVSDLQSVTVNLKDPGNLDGSPLVSETITTFDNTTTLTTWNAGTQQHFVVSFTADELSFMLTDGERLVHISMVAVTTGGQTGTICVGSINIIDDGGNSPASNPANAITVGQAQAMVAALAWAGGVNGITTAANFQLGSDQTWLLGVVPFTAAAGSGAYIANIIILDANALPGALMRIPIDFAASTNPTIKIYDNATTGTLLQTVTNPGGAAQSFLFTARFDGTAWHKELGTGVQR